jgi:hypothetical protein
MPVIVYFHEKNVAEKCETPKDLYDFLKSFDSVGIYIRPGNKIFIFDPGNVETKIYYVETKFPSQRQKFEYYATDSNLLWKMNNFTVYGKFIVSKIFIFSHGPIIFLGKCHRINPYKRIINPTSVEKMLLE